MEDRRREKEQAVKLRNMKEGWRVEDQMFRWATNAGMKEREKGRSKELKKLKERWEEEDIEKEREREVDERRRTWKWEMNNPRDFSGI